MRALILMAGEGQRFKDAGYTFPKPLIDVGNGKSMIELVVETLLPCNEYVFCCRKEHLEKYNLEQLLQNITNGRAKIVAIDKLTEGAACTALLAKESIDNDEPLLIANSDQYVTYDSINFHVLRNRPDVDGIIFTSYASHPKWSFVTLRPDLTIDRVAEKVPISNIITCGLYYFSHGDDFVFAAESMIEKNIRTNGEFYLAPCYNELVDTHNIFPFFVDTLLGTGTPEDLETYKKYDNVHK